MNATKRKFNALIQGIGTRPSSSDSNSSHLATGASDDMAAVNSSPAATHLLSKRRRLGMGILGTTSANEKSTPPASPSNNTQKFGSPKSTPLLRAPVTNVTNVTTTVTLPTGASHAPKYCPGDRDELIRRLATFQELTEWSPKPDKINEIQWAKRGWVSQGKDRVRCILCNKELLVQTSKRQVDGQDVPILAGSDIEEALADKFAALIVDAHQEDCLWRKRGCDDSLLRLSLASPDTALASLRQKYDELCTRSAFLPYVFNLRLPESLSLQSIKSQLPQDFFVANPPPPPTQSRTTTKATSSPNDVALALALTGWQGLSNPRIGPVPNSASCATCLRRLGLWMFKSKEVDEATGEILVPAPMGHLDPVREHRFFCPWRNGAAQRNPGSKKMDAMAAWEVQAQTLKNHSFLRAQGEKSSRRQTSPRRPFHRPTSSVPVTPTKGGNLQNHQGDERLVMLGPDMVSDEEDNGNGEQAGEEDMAARDAKDKERWARLRRVKSLFDTKASRKIRRTLSRPGSARSGGARPETANTTRTANSTTASVAEENGVSGGASSGK